MIRFLVLSFLVVIICDNGTSGKPARGDFRSILQVDFSDGADPTNNLPSKRSFDPNPHDPEVPNPANPSSTCYFIQESETESQITCQLRFTRSQFNFNPFGLRFGKRQLGIWAGRRKLASTSSRKILQALLKPELDKMMGQCGGNLREDC